MIQRSTYTSRKKTPPQKFIPRRDLFPDAELPPSVQSASEKTTGSNSASRQQDGSTYSKSQQVQPQARPQARVQPITSVRAQPKKSQPLPLQQPLKPVKQQGLFSVNPAILLFLLAGGFLLWPKLKASQPKLASKIESTFKNIVDNPQSIQMLRTIGPYLEDAEQDAVYTVAGVLEAVSTFRGVMTHTYHDRYRNTILHVPKSPAAKRLEIMKAMKPYIPESSRSQLDQAIGVYNTIDQLNRNIDIYRNNRLLAAERKPTTLETLVDLYNVMRPALPLEYKEKGDKAVQVFKMMEAAGAAEKMSRSSKKEKPTQKGEVNHKQDRVKTRSSNEDSQDSKATEHPSAKADQMQSLMDSFAPMLNDEQKDSLNMIMKMAQLLSQPGNASEAPDNEEE
jgi:hypothetical protein